MTSHLPLNSAPVSNQSTMDSLPDRQILLIAAVSSAGVYWMLSLVLVKLQLPLLAAVFVGSNMISRTSVFQRAIRQAVESRQRRRLSLFGNSSSSSESLRGFESLSDTAKIELLLAMNSLDAYLKNSRSQNARRRKLFKLLSWRQQKMCEEAGYLAKLKQIDQLIDKNQQTMDGVISSAKTEYGLTYKDFALLEKEKNLPNTSSTNYRVIEALTHYVRDWTAEGEVETEPLLEYVKNQLGKIIPEEEVGETCVVIPGSGVGRVAHEVANFRDFGAVYAIEFSGLMHACNKYIYEEKAQKAFYPYIHLCLNFVKTLSQFRERQLPTPELPSNLHLCLDDFRYFSIPNRDKYKNVVVVTVFFVDTAENLIDYLDVINQLTTPSKRNPVKNGYWVNVGPLKYGTAAQVELNVEELQQIRKKIGWKDMDVKNTLEDSANRTTGYITDTESMWQGFYGLAMWSSAHHGNSRKTW